MFNLRYSFLYLLLLFLLLFYSKYRPHLFLIVLFFIEKEHE